MLENLLIYSLAGFVVYIIASRHTYKQEVIALREIVRINRKFIEERNNNG